MKKLCFILLLGAAACTRQPADHFILRGTVPGAMDSTKVTLRTITRWDKDLASAYVIDGKFELRGQLDAPSMCKFSVSNTEYILRSKQNQESAYCYELNFFVENGKLTFTTPHIDSLPPAYWLYDIRKEKNYRVEGSSAQEAYYRYQQQTFPLRYGIQELRKQEKQTPDYNSRLETMKSELDKASRAFIRNNDNLATNLYIVGTLKKPAFTYNQAYLDELEELFASCQDTCAALREFRHYLRDASRLVQGSPLQEGEVVDDKGKSVSLLAQLNRDGYTLIDFWASWCIPCRASLIYLREVYKTHGDSIRFISVSLDQQEAEWQKALKEENLPWAQFRSLPEQTKAFAEQYNLIGIPTFFIIDSEGRIVFSGSSINELAEQLPKINTNTTH